MVVCPCTCGGVSCTTLGMVVCLSLYYSRDGGVCLSLYYSRDGGVPVLVLL